MKTRNSRPGGRGALAAHAAQRRSNTCLVQIEAPGQPIVGDLPRSSLLNTVNHGIQPNRDGFHPSRLPDKQDCGSCGDGFLVIHFVVCFPAFSAKDKA